MHEPVTTLESKVKPNNRIDALTTYGRSTGNSMNPEQQGIQPNPSAARFRYANNEKPLDGYTIQQGIGIGGFGEVYFAVSDAGKEVALKRIQRNLDVELRGVQNCLNLKHLNLISLWDIRTDQAGDSWVVMEYVPGPSLRDIIEVSENGMPGHQIDRWFGPIAAGVNYLHDSGIVHRDLKPANIFLDEDENVIKIGDYGLSKFISTSQGGGQTETVGTFHYMAPEIGKGIYGKGVDIYAMGIILFEMLTGTVPFRGESSQEIIMKHLTADPDLGNIPFDFREVIHRSLIKDPEQRFGSISEMQNYLPWNESSSGQAKPTINSQRFGNNAGFSSVKSRTDKRKNDDASPLADVLERSKLEKGILFGPLRDSTAGVPMRNAAHSFVTKENARESEIVFIAGEQATSKNEPIVSQKFSPDSKREPIAQVVTTGWGGLTDWWNDTTVSTPLKVFVLLVSGFAIAANSEWLLPAVLALGFLYLVYYGIRNLVLSPVEGELQPKKLSKRKQRQLIHASMRQELTQADFIGRATSLTGSLLIAAIVCIALNLPGLAITDSLFDSAIDSWALFTWSTVISVVCSWSLLTIGKFYESSDGQWMQRRFTMLIVGVLVGGIAVLTANYFAVDFEKAASIGSNPLDSTSLTFIDGNSLLINILFFAGVFGLLRWWRLVDPTRRTKLSIWSVGLCLIWAALFSHVLNFAPLLNCLLVVVVSIAIQLSSPWISEEKRNALVSG